MINLSIRTGRPNIWMGQPYLGRGGKRQPQSSTAYPLDPIMLQCYMKDCTGEYCH